MNLRAKLVLAQAPLAIALCVLGAVSLRTTRELGHGSDAILRDNYRSVLAAQQMKEAAERIDSAATFLALGDRERGLGQLAEYVPRFEAALRLEEQNPTEPGEAEATRALRSTWQVYQVQLAGIPSSGLTHTAREVYFGELQPQFVRLKAGADAVLAMNQDAMVAKSDRARALAQRVDLVLVVGTLLALLVGGVASFALTSRLLRPLGILTRATRRLGEGDLSAEARVDGRDEIAQLGLAFNEMAQRLRRYRETTLGELLQAQHASQAAIDSLPDAVVLLDAKGAVLGANLAAERDLHVALDRGDAALARVVPEIRELLERMRAHVFSGKGVYQPKGFEEALRTAEAGADRYLLPRASPVYAEGGAVSGAAVLLQDVTRLRRFDELKNDLVATVAHEFRTPLTSLRMAIHLCLEGAAGPLTEKQIDLLHAGREDCERLQGIVDDLLDVSRLQSGRAELQRTKVPAPALLDRAIEISRAQADARHVALAAEDLAPGLEAEVDVERIELVVTNLVNNAIRHAPEGSTVTVRARPEGGRLRLEVRDAGEGIPDDYRERVFEKFFRVPGTAGGAGLGLYICKEIVLAHGGDIGVDSAPGQGSTFWFTVPATS